MDLNFFKQNTPTFSLQELSKKIGDEVAKQSSMVENAFEAQRIFLVTLIFFFGGETFFLKFLAFQF